MDVCDNWPRRERTGKYNNIKVHTVGHDVCFPRKLRCWWSDLHDDAEYWRPKVDSTRDGVPILYDYDNICYDYEINAVVASRSSRFISSHHYKKTDKTVIYYLCQLNANTKIDITIYNTVLAVYSEDLTNFPGYMYMYRFQMFDTL
jgi:hypothetical protein